MKKLYLLLFLLPISISLAGQSAKNNQSIRANLLSSDPAWIQKSPMDIARGGMRSCVIGDMIYVFGGMDEAVDNTLDSADVYNTLTDEWNNLADIPVDIMDMIVESVNDTIYLAGGYKNEGVNQWNALPSVFQYDPENNTWKELGNLSEGSAGSASCILNESIYIMGGISNASTGANKLWSYEPGSDTWETLQDMSFNCATGGSAVVYHGKIFSFKTNFSGALAASPLICRSEVYDPVADTWSDISDMPVEVKYNSSIIYNDKIYLFGGDSSWVSGGNWGISRGTNFIQEYDPDTDSWRLMKGMPFNRGKKIVELVGDSIYLIGGFINSRDLDQPLAEVWRFRLDSLKVWENFPCEGVSISDHPDTLKVGDQANVSAVPIPSNMDNPDIVWSSDNEDVAFVDQEGVVSAISDGTANIIATVLAGGCSNSFELTIGGVTVPEDEIMSMKVFPNPAGEYVCLKLEQIEAHKLEIYSIIGKCLHQSFRERSEYQVDLSSFDSGIYFLTIRTEDIARTIKLVKK